MKDRLLELLSSDFYLTSRQMAMKIRQTYPALWQELKAIRREEGHHSTLSAMASKLRELVPEGLVDNQRLWEPSMNKNYINIWKKTV